MATRKPWIAASTLVVLALVALFTFGQPTPTKAAGPDEDCIALLYAEGVIMGNAPSDNPLGGSSDVSSIDMVQKLEDARKDDKIKAVVIRVNSPGGSAAASQEIYDAIVKCKAEKPVYISMGDICASGGYYISAASSKIWATPATLTGSIGVIMELPRYDALLNKIGVEMRTMKAGAHKDLGSGTREMTPEEQAILQNLLTTTHAQFIKAVADGRTAAGAQGLDEAGVRAIADGTIWTGADAKTVGLVDELGGLNDVLIYAATQAGLDPEDFVVDEMRTSFFDELAEEMGVPASRSPLGGLGSLMRGAAAQLLLGQAAPSLATPSTLPVPQTGVQGLANRMYLCDSLLGGGLSF